MGFKNDNCKWFLNILLVFDSDAQAFITAAGLTNTSQKDACNSLVLNLKSAGVWSKLKAIYPLVGGNSTAHAVNLKSPATFDISFLNSPIHDSGGVLTSFDTGVDFGTNQNWIYRTWGNTNLYPPDVGANDVHISFYSRTNTGNNGNGFDIFQNSDSGSSRVGMHCRWSNGNFYGDCYDISASGRASISVSDSLGLHVLSRTASNDLRIFKNGTQLASNNGATPGNSDNSYQFTLGACHRQCAFASIGYGTITH